jgi:hypothetical protein
MASRKPVVLGPDGLAQQLQPGDTTTIHAKFTGTLTSVPAISLGQTQSLVVSMAPIVPGDALVVGEDISWVFAGPLPGGVNVAQVRVTSVTAVTIDFTSSALLSLQTISVGMRVTAHR